MFRLGLILIVGGILWVGKSPDWFGNGGDVEPIQNWGFLAIALGALPFLWKLIASLFNTAVFLLSLPFSTEGRQAGLLMLWLVSIALIYIFWSGLIAGILLCVSALIFAIQDGHFRLPKRKSRYEKEQEKAIAEMSRTEAYARQKIDEALQAFLAENARSRNENR